MDLEKWYRRGGFVAGCAVAASFFALIYLWLAGVRMMILNSVFQGCLLTFFSWAVLSPFFIRSWRNRVFPAAVVACILIVIPLILFGARFLLLFVPTFVLLESWYSLAFTGFYVFLILAFARSAALDAELGPNFRKRSLIVLCTTLILLLVPEMMAVRVAKNLQRGWYTVLLKTRGQYVPRWPRVAVVDIVSPQIPEKQLRDLIEILAASHPSVITLISPATPDFKLSNEGVELIRAYGPNLKDPESPYGLPTIDPIEGWGSLDRDLPLYYIPYSPSGIDLGVKTAYFYLKKQTFHVSDRRVQVATSQIPLQNDGKVLINYYRDTKRETYGGWTTTYEKSAFAHYGYMEWYEGDRRKTSLWGSGRASGTSVTVNYEKKRLEARIGKEIVVTGFRRRDLEPVKLRELQDNIMILNVEHVPRWFTGTSNLSMGVVYASIIQNILDENFLTEPPRGVSVVLALCMVALVAWAFNRFTVYWAAAGVLAVALVAAGILMFIFLYYDVLIDPYPIALPFMGALAFLLPVGIAADRQSLFQEQSRLQAELNTAHDMQMGLMPVADPVVKGYDISGLCVPANEVGGDFFDYVWLDRKQTKFGIALADVSGKAMKAAMTAVMTSGMIYRELGSNGTPKTILRRINKPMYAKLDQRMFTAMSLAAIDLKTKELTLSNAGQVHPLMLRGGQVQRLKVEGERLPLGVMEEVRYEELKMKLRKGDAIIFFTDGVVEAMNSERELYGTERLEQELLSAGGFTAKALREHIIASVGQFAGKAEQHDDMTVVVVRVL